MIHTGFMVLLCLKKGIYVALPYTGRNQVWTLTSFYNQWPMFLSIFTYYKNKKYVWKYWLHLKTTLKDKSQLHVLYMQLCKKILILYFL